MLLNTRIFNSLLLQSPKKEGVISLLQSLEVLWNKQPSLKRNDMDSMEAQCNNITSSIFQLLAYATSDRVQDSYVIQIFLFIYIINVFFVID